MSEKDNTKVVSSRELNEGDRVTVHVNSRAANHLGTRSFEAVVQSRSFSDVKFKPLEPLQDEYETHTWYADIGYIQGYHDGLDMYTDIGKVRKVEK
jgi:hypothetical protein